MNWHDFEFFTDENIHPKVVEYLQNKGFIIFDVKTEHINGSNDDYLFELAQNKQSIFITHDSDFGKISYKNTQFLRGVIYLRPAHINYQVSINSLEAIFSSISDLDNSFFIVAKNNGTNIKIRFRKTNV
jgi:predicted nuclease of predicted toxin-antitoxin system